MNVRSRAFTFTWNNYPDEHQDCLDALVPRYVCYGYEWAPHTGTPHLQGYLYFDNARTLRSVRQQLPGLHVVVSKGTPAENITYCSKEGEFVEFGTRPQTPQEIGQAEADRYEVAWNAARRGSYSNLRPGELDAIDAELRFRHYNTIKQIAKDHMVRPPQLESTCGIWIHGVAGSGKTTAVNRTFPTAYLKPLNKWWDGYQDEEVVVLDDMDIYHRDLTSQIKHWADFLPFIGEIKCGSRYLRPKKFIVTSQYSIEKIWEHDPESLAAISRRFTVIEKIQGQDIIL